MEDPAPYRTGPANSAEPLLATEDLIALAHAHQGISYETDNQWLARLPDEITNPIAYKLRILRSCQALIFSIRN